MGKLGELGALVVYCVAPIVLLSFVGGLIGWLSPW